MRLVGLSKKTIYFYFHLFVVVNRAGAGLKRPGPPTMGPARYSDYLTYARGFFNQSPFVGLAGARDAAIQRLDSHAKLSPPGVRLGIVTGRELRKLRLRSHYRPPCTLKPSHPETNTERP